MPRQGLNWPITVSLVTLWSVGGDTLPGVTVTEACSTAGWALRCWARAISAFRHSGMYPSHHHARRQAAIVAMHTKLPVSTAPGRQREVRTVWIGCTTHGHAVGGSRWRHGRLAWNAGPRRWNIPPSSSLQHRDDELSTPHTFLPRWRRRRPGASARSPARRHRRTEGIQRAALLCPQLRVVLRRPQRLVHQRLCQEQLALAGEELDVVLAGCNHRGGARSAGRADVARTCRGSRGRHSDGQLGLQRTPPARPALVAGAPR
jgi:hypothetical protein